MPRFKVEISGKHLERAAFGRALATNLAAFALPIDKDLHVEYFAFRSNADNVRDRPVLPDGLLNHRVTFHRAGA